MLVETNIIYIIIILIILLDIDMANLGPHKGVYIDGTKPRVFYCEYCTQSPVPVGLCPNNILPLPPPAVNNGMIIELILFFILVLQHDLSSMNIRFLYFVF